MSLIDFLIRVVAILVAFPIIAYLVVKYGTFAYFKGRLMFYQHYRRPKNGKHKEKATPS